MPILKNNFLSSLSQERIKKNQELFAFLHPIMNQINKTGYSQRFWKIILSKYVSAVITDIYYLSANRIKKNSTFEVINNSINNKIEEKFLYYLRNVMISAKTITNYKRIKLILEKNNNIGVGFFDEIGRPNEIEVNLPSFHYFNNFYKKNNDKRRILYKISNEISDPFLANVINMIPKIYVEYFDLIMRMIPLYAPWKKQFHVMVMDSSFIRFLVAKYSESGANLYFYQHGGDYGEFIYHSPYAYEYDIADRFFSWGWKLNDKDIPSKAYRLEKFKYNYLHHKSEKNNCLIVFGGIIPINYEFNKSNALYLLENIDRNKFNIIIARPRKTAVKLSNKSILNFLVNRDLIIDDGRRNISELVKEAKIVIQLRFPSTNALECFYVNHPTICLLENDNPTEIAQYFYNRLIRLNILHTDIQSLVNFINKVNIEHWWAQIVTNENYLEYKNTFLREVQY